ncbi:MAG: PstS family phosphate ABC transporter substrate-binding protein [Rickettsiales bacterium]|nr:PstS family phosphate ABC transporter substrate-binding protein [Rickettsiales bacterium]
MHINIFVSLLLLIICSTACAEEDRQQVRIVGSSTVYPFVTVAAEHFGKETDFKTPVVESTGTGGGFKLFCQGDNRNTPDMVNASRPIKASEKKLCRENGVHEVQEITLGYDGIVLANASNARKFELTRKQIFLALAKQVPVKGKLVENPYERWNQINPELPNIPISVYGPPPTSGTRDAFVELVMDEGCATFPEYKQIFLESNDYKKACHLLREDGRFVDSSENDNLIVMKLKTNPEALGIFGFSFLEQNREHVQPAKIEGVEPLFDTIADGSYRVSRPLFTYVKTAHYALIPALRPFIEELTSERAIGVEGYLLLRGLIPLPPEKARENIRIISLD